MESDDIETQTIKNIPYNPCMYGKVRYKYLHLVDFYDKCR